MALLKIARMGHPVLTGMAAPVDDPGAPEIRRLVTDMLETMADAGGTGLAAPQVHVPLRLFVYLIDAGRTGTMEGDTPIGPTVVINPQLEAVGEEQQLCWEGCLSIPGMRAVVPRLARIRYQAVDCDGAAFTHEVAGFHADVVQHEYDHLNGVLYPMRVTDWTRYGFTEDVSRAEAARQAATRAAD